MDIVYWGKYLVMVLFGTLLVLLSVHECVDELQMSVKPKEWLRSIVRYSGLFILIYSAYCIIIDVMLYR